MAAQMCTDQTGLYDPAPEAVRFRLAGLALQRAKEVKP
jgi:hypothetical protein